MARWSFPIITLRSLVQIQAAPPNCKDSEPPPVLHEAISAKGELSSVLIILPSLM